MADFPRSYVLSSVIPLLLACRSSEHVAAHDVSDVRNADSAADSGPADTGSDGGADSALDSGDETGLETGTADGSGDATASKALCAILRRDDLWADGLHEHGYRSQVDAVGNLLFNEYTDGAGVGRARVDYTYDAAGNVLVEASDHEADGVVDTTRTSTYDPYGNELTRVTSGMWASDYAWSYTYDTDGNVLVGEYDGYDDHTDGVVDERDMYTRDTGGHALVVTYDYEADGDADLTITRSWEADHLLTEGWDYDGLTDSWGVPYADKSYAYTYDSDGNVLTAGVGSDVWTYTYDEAGNVLTETADYGGDEILDRQFRYAYDGDGNVLATESFKEGAWELLLSYTWVAGLLARMEVHTDGAVSDWQEYAYDAAGDLTEIVSYEGTGEADFRSTYTYECDG